MLILCWSAQLVTLVSNCIIHVVGITRIICAARSLVIFLVCIKSASWSRRYPDSPRPQTASTCYLAKKKSWDFLGSETSPDKTERDLPTRIQYVRVSTLDFRNIFLFIHWTPKYTLCQNPVFGIQCSILHATEICCILHSVVSNPLAIYTRVLVVGTDMLHYVYCLQWPFYWFPLSVSL